MKLLDVCIVWYASYSFYVGGRYSFFLTKIATVFANLNRGGYLLITALSNNSQDYLLVQESIFVIFVLGCHRVSLMAPSNTSAHKVGCISTLAST